MTLGNRDRRTALTGAKFALLAIVAQLVLTFGHVHPLPSPIATAQQIEASHDGPLGSDDGLGGDCALCVSIAAFSTLDIPHGGEPSGPAFLRIERLNPPAIAFSTALAALPPFNSRAPPSA